MKQGEKIRRLEAECSAYYLLYKEVISEYQHVMNTTSNPGVANAAREMREEIERLRAALIRWHRANETRDFIAADDAIAAIAAELAHAAGGG